MGLSEGVPSSGYLKPTLKQLLEQGLVRKARIISGENKGDIFIPSNKLCPNLPKDEDWISLEGLTDEDIKHLNTLFHSAQKNGIVFVKNDGGSIFAKDRTTIEGYCLTWSWVNVDSFSSDLELSDEEKKLRDEMKKPNGNLVKEESLVIRNIQDINDNALKKSIVMIGDEVVYSGTNPLITDICFDEDTLFDLRDDYAAIMQNAQVRFHKIMSQLKNSPN